MTRKKSSKSISFHYTIFPLLAHHVTNVILGIGLATVLHFEQGT